MKYHGPLYGKITGKYIPLKQHSDYVDKLEMDLKSQRLLANELIAAIRNFSSPQQDPHQVDQWLQPFIARLIPYEAPTGLEP